MLRERGPGTKVRGGGGIALHVVEAGNPAAQPLLFIHGYLQSTYSWRKQFESDLGRDFRLIAFDLRGHGASEKPLDAAAYADSKLWADDVAAVLEQLDLQRAVVVAWSYAGYVIADYLRFYGARRLGGLALVAAVTCRGDEKVRNFGAPGFVDLFPAVFSSDPEVLQPILRRFIDLSVADPTSLDESVRAELLAASELVPAVAREAMQRRKLENDDVLRALVLPAICMHGAEDAVVLLASSEHNARTIPGAQLSVYPRAGHSVFVEDSVHFNREIRELAARVA